MSLTCWSCEEYTDDCLMAGFPNIGDKCQKFVYTPGADERASSGRIGGKAWKLEIEE